MFNNFYIPVQVGQVRVCPWRVSAFQGAVSACVRYPPGLLSASRGSCRGNAVENRIEKVECHREISVSFYGRIAGQQGINRQEAVVWLFRLFPGKGS